MSNQTTNEVKVQKTFEDIAKESIRVEIISGCYYAFGSELAILRIFAKYQTNGKYHNPRAIVGYSQTDESHYFCLESKF